MSHSTLTWFSSQFAPKYFVDSLFVLAHSNGGVMSLVFDYNPDKDQFESLYDNVQVRRAECGYWAYVPTQIDFHEKLEKQSQTPTE